jgi:cytochrome oxidase Cu insertion factor (SCO1/SenC/PrrC family)
MTKPNKKTGRHRLILLLIVGLFTVPLIGAFWLYQHPEAWQLKTVNYGKLISPPDSISSILLRDTSDSTLTPSQYRGKWLLLFVSLAPCATHCLDNLYKIQQVRLSLAKNSSQVVTILVSSVADKDREFYRLMQKEFPTITYLIAEKTSANTLVTTLTMDESEQKDGMLYIVDPQSQVMMSYSSLVPPEHLLKDMKRLVRG